MQRSVLVLGWLVVAACGDGGASGPDGGLAVTVVAPNGGETLIAAEPFELRWQLAGGAALPCDVDLIDADGRAIEVARGRGSSAVGASDGGLTQHGHQQGEGALAHPGASSHQNPRGGQLGFAPSAIHVRIRSTSRAASGAAFLGIRTPARHGPAPASFQSR